MLVTICPDFISATFVPGRVVSIKDDISPGFEGIQRVETEVLRGELKNSTVTANNFISAYEGYNINVKEDKKVILQITDYGEPTQKISVKDYYRAPSLIYVLLIFLILFFLIGGWKNKKVLGALGLNIVLIIFTLLPLIKRGFPPLISTVLIVGGGICITIYIIFGPGKKFRTAVSGSIFGIFLGGILTLITTDWLYLSGFFSREARMLLLVSRHLPGWNITDLKGIMAAGIMVAASGAVVDIAVTITSACKNISEQAGSISSGRIWQAGIHVGRDIIATMLNSLILVFTGLSLPLIAVFEILDISFYRVINFEVFAVLILSAIISSTAMVLTVPVTSFISSRVFKR